MKKISISQLGDQLRSLLSRTQQDELVIVEDEAGRVRYGITPYFRATPEERAQAWRNIEAMQEKAARSMKAHNVTEDDVMRLLLEDD